MEVAKYADMMSAMGAEPRLRIMRLLLSAHPRGMTVGEIQEQLGIPNSTLSHHLEKLRQENLVTVERKGTFLHYRADARSLHELLSFLYEECCARSGVIDVEEIVPIQPDTPKDQRRKKR